MGTTSEGKNDQLVMIAQNTGLGIPGKLYFVGVRFVLAVIITRTLGPEKYGSYMLALNSIEIIGISMLFGIDTAMVRFVSHHLERGESGHVKRVIDSGLRVAAISGLVITGGVFLLSDTIAANIFGKPELAHVLRIMALALPFIALMRILLSTLEGAKLVKYSILVDQVVRPTIRFILIVAAFGIGWRLMGVVWAWVVSSFVAFLISAYYLTRMVRKLGEEKKPKGVQGLFKFSLPVWMNKMLARNNSNITVLLIGVFLATDQVGIYSVGQRLIALLLIPFMAFNTIYSPIISSLFTKNCLNELESTYKIGSRWIIGLTLPVFVLMMFFSKEIVLILGQGFAESYKVLRVLLIAQMVNVCTGSTAYVLSMTGKPIYNLANSILALLLNILLSIVMIKNFGVVGAAYSLGICIIVVNLLQILEVYYLYKIHPFCLSQLKLFVSCGLSLVVITVANSAFKSLPIYFEVAGISGSFIFVYLALLLLMGLSDEDYMIWRKMRNRINYLKIRKRASNCTL